jgi:hypothetical protein
MKIRSIIIAIAALLSACDSEPEFTFGFQDEGMRLYILKGLEQRDVWYRLEGEGRITMYKKDLPIAQEIGAEFREQTIPFGRSAGVNSKAQTAIEEALRKAGGNYRITTFGAATLPADAEEIGMSAEWFVFEPGHEEKGFEIINEVTRNFDFWAETEPAGANK